MFRKSTIVALAAVASLGAVALSSTSASAFARFGARVGAVRFSAARVGAPRLAVNRNFAFRRLAIIKLHPPHPHPHWVWWWHPHHRLVWGAPIIAGGVTYASTPSYASTPTSNNCNCLTKTYTQDGAVVFKDLCTNEMAMNPPAADQVPTAPQGVAPQQPVQPMQQGYLQPQPAQ